MRASRACSQPASALSSSERPMPAYSSRPPTMPHLGRCANGPRHRSWSNPNPRRPTVSQTITRRARSADPPGAAAAADDSMVVLDDVARVFGRGDGQVRAVDGVSLSLAPGTFTAIMGPSGSGKSTLLQLAAGLDRPTQGRVHLAGQELGGLGERALARLRRERIGFV